MAGDDETTKNKNEFEHTHTQARARTHTHIRNDSLNRFAIEKHFSSVEKRL